MVKKSEFNRLRIEVRSQILFSVMLSIKSFCKKLRCDFVLDEDIPIRSVKKKRENKNCFVSFAAKFSAFHSFETSSAREGYRWALPELGQGAPGCLPATNTMAQKKHRSHCNLCLKSISGSKYHVHGCSLSPSQQNYYTLHEFKYIPSEEDTTSCCTRGGLDWKLGKISSLKGLFSPGICCPRQAWSHHPWRGFKSHVDMALWEVV